MTGIARKRPAHAAGLLLVFALTSLAGCGRRPQVAPDAYELIAGLRTAISAQRTDWLESTAQLVARRHAAGELNDEQRAEFDLIVDQARAGNWAAAHDEVVKLAKAQRPSSVPAEANKPKKHPERTNPSG